MIPAPKVRKIAPLSCRCGSTKDLILDDGPPVCRACIKEGGVMGQATVRRNDTRDHDNREGAWPE